jgi:hypothetical protein
MWLPNDAARALWSAATGESPEIPMTKRLACAVFMLMLAGPALAQHPEQDPNAGRRGRSTVPPGGIYYSGRGGEANSAHWKASGKPKAHATPKAPARHHAAAVRK